MCGLLALVVRKGSNFAANFMWPFATCFASAEDGQPVYLLRSTLNREGQSDGD